MNKITNKLDNDPIRFKELVNRQDYLVVQSNDLAKTFGNLSTLEHKLLDYCFSHVKKGDKSDTAYFLEMADLELHFGYELGGNRYKDIFKAFSKLESDTAFYYQSLEFGEPVLLKGRLLQIGITKNKQIMFRFREEARRFVFELANNYYLFSLAELSIIRSKYTLILIKLLEAHRQGSNRVTEIEASLDDLKLWFLGSDLQEDKEQWDKWTASRFRQKVLDVASKEINNKFRLKNVTVENIKRGRLVIGYRIKYTALDQKQSRKKQIN